MPTAVACYPCPHKENDRQEKCSTFRKISYLKKHLHIEKLHSRSFSFSLKESLIVGKIPPTAQKLTNSEWHPWKIWLPNEDVTLFFFVIFCSTVGVSLFSLIPSQTAVINTERSEALTSTLLIIKWKKKPALHRHFFSSPAQIAPVRLVSSPGRKERIHSLNVICGKRSVTV